MRRSILWVLAWLSFAVPDTTSAQLNRSLPPLPNPERWPVMLHEALAQLDAYERTSDRDAARKALAEFVARLDDDTTYLAHYGAARTLFVAPFLVPPPVLVMPSSQHAALRLMTESKGPMRSAEAAWVAGLLALEADRKTDVRAVLNAFLDSDWPVADTGLVNVLDDLAVRAEDEELFVKVGDKLAAATKEHGFVFLGQLWRAAFAGEKARIAPMFDSVLASAGPLAVHALRRHGHPILEGGTIEPTAPALRRAWLKIGAASGLSAHDRIAEHYLRLAEVNRKYRAAAQASRGPQSDGAFDRITGRFDHRGDAYLRHGRPDRVIVSPGTHLRPNETWVYDVPRGGSPYFTFALFPGSSGFVLMDDYLEVVAWESLDEVVRSGSSLPNLSNAKIDALARAGVFDELGNWFSLRDQADPRFAHMGAMFSRVAALARTYNHSRVRELLADNQLDNLLLMASHSLDLRKAITSHSVVPKFAADLPFAVDLYQFRQAGGSVLYTAFATQLRHVQPSTGTRAIGSRVQLVVDTNILAVDTVIRFNVPAGAPETSAIGFIAPLSIPVLEADGDVLITVRGGAAGRQIQAKHRLRDLSGFAVSGIVVAEDRETGTFRRGNIRLTANPHGQLPVGATAVLYYEIYGLSEGDAYETELLFERVNEPGLSADDLKMLIGRARTSLRVQFSGQAENTSDLYGVQERRGITTELAPGLYAVTVRVTQRGSGRVAESRRNVRIVRRDG